MLTRRSFIKTVGAVAGAAGALAPCALTAGDGNLLPPQSSDPSPKYLRSILPVNPSSVWREIQEFVDRIPIIDTHEHLLSEPRLLEDAHEHYDFTQLFMNYIHQDIIGAGLPEETWDSLFATTKSTEWKWEILAPYIPKVQNTAYYWVIDLAVRHYYGMDGLSASNYQELSEKIRNEYRPGIYQRILGEASGIDKAVVDPCDCEVAENFTDRSILIPAININPWIGVHGKEDLDKLAKEFDRDLIRVPAFREAIGTLIGAWRKRGIVAAKISLAYDRPLDFKFVDEPDAQRALDTLWKKDDRDAARVLQDYLFHVVVQHLTDNGLPFQIHTGLLGQSNYGTLAQTNPMLMADVFAHYKTTKFDVFHAGYPWMRELGTLGRIDTSVYADMCWAQFINPVAAVAALDEWLDSMPASKILAFGGDYWNPEGTFGHCIIARTNIGEVLANRVERRRMTMEDAMKVARMILRDNALELFGL